MLDALSLISSSDIIYNWIFSGRRFDFEFSSFISASISMGMRGTKIKASMAPKKIKPKSVNLMLLPKPKSFDGP